MIDNCLFNPYQVDFTPQEIVQELNRYIVGQEHLKNSLALAVYRHFKRIKKRETDDQVMTRIKKPNIMVCGPSGTGKTETIELMKRILGLPGVLVDVTSFTEAGFVGEDVEKIPSLLVQNCGNNFEMASLGIIHLDEIDKICKKRTQGVDVSGTGVQRQLLRMLEGKDYQINISKSESRLFSTNDVLFIASGAFAGIEDLVNQRIGARSLGFKEKMELQNKSTVPTVKDLIKYGMLPEFLRRFSVFTYTHDLNEENLYQILRLDTSAVRRGAAFDFANEGIELRFEDDAYRALAKKAAKNGIGASGLDQVLEEILDDYLSNLIGTDCKELALTKNIVEHPKEELRKIKKGLKKVFKKDVEEHHEEDLDHLFPKNDREYYWRMVNKGLSTNLAYRTYKSFYAQRMDPDTVSFFIEGLSERLLRYRDKFQETYGKELDFSFLVRYELIGREIESRTTMEFELDRTFKFHAHEEEIKRSPLNKIVIGKKEFDHPEEFYERLASGNIF